MNEKDMIDICIEQLAENDYDIDTVEQNGYLTHAG